MRVLGLAWMGVRTDQFAAMVTFYRDVMRLTPVQLGPAAWFQMADGNEMHVYGEDEDHAFFGLGPVVGLLVDDAAAARTAMTEAGIEFNGEQQQEDGSLPRPGRQHLRDHQQASHVACEPPSPGAPNRAMGSRRDRELADFPPRVAPKRSGFRPR